MQWREVLAAAQAAPIPRDALDEVVAGCWPGARVQGVTVLAGGLGSVLHRVDLDDAPVASVVLRQLLAEFGDDAVTVEREVAVHAAARAAGVVAPEVHWTDPGGTVLGRPALLLAHVPGRLLLGDLDTDDGRRAMAGVLRHVQLVDATRLDVLPRMHDLHTVTHRFWPPPASSELVDAAALNAAVEAAAPAFDAGASVVHGDLHAGNVLWDGRRVTGLLDWAGASVGNPLADEAYAWFDTCLAHGRVVGDALQSEVDRQRPGSPPSADAVHLWRGVALLRGLPSPAPWAEAYRAAGVEVDDATVEARFVDLVTDHVDRS